MPIDLTGDTDGWLHGEPDDMPPLRLSQRYSDEEFSEEIRDFLRKYLTNHLFYASRPGTQIQHDTTLRSYISEHRERHLSKTMARRVAELMLNSLSDEIIRDIVDNATAQLDRKVVGMNPGQVLDYIGYMASKIILDAVTENRELDLEWNEKMIEWVFEVEFSEEKLSEDEL